MSNGVGVVENQYDFMSRRVAKVTAMGTNKFVYDGWLPVREQSASGGNATSNHYVWGLDLSGSLQGAGGIGGLLMATLDDEAYFPAYDANGNVTEYTDTNGTVVAHYEYDPFGNVSAQSDAMAADFAYRFSTKYTDDETGLVYYGFRFYSPTLGRWISRDPIFDLQRLPGIGLSGRLRGSISRARTESSLYEFVENDPLNVFDVLGLASCRPPKVWKDKPGAPPITIDGCSYPRYLGWLLDGPDKDHPSPSGTSFYGACANHDTCYQTCGSDKAKCDQNILDDMLAACHADPNNRPPGSANMYWCENWARKYAWAVRNFGGGPFNNDQAARCKCECP